MNCRRCQSLRLLALEKRVSEDNDVYRCRDCGYLFSPGETPNDTPVRVTTVSGPPRTAAMEPGYIEPGYIEPGYIEPGYIEPGYPGGL